MTVINLKPKQDLQNNILQVYIIILIIRHT